MKRSLALSAALLVGVLFGALLPLALAHAPDECECECVCQECPEVVAADPLLEDIDGDGIQEFLQVEEEDTEAIRKALEAIEAAEQQERQMLQQEQEHPVEIQQQDQAGE